MRAAPLAGAARAGGGAGAAAAAPPGPGRYEAVLCVATLPGAEPSCGSVELELRSGGRMSVRVADIVYHLALGRSQLEVVTCTARCRSTSSARPTSGRARRCASATPAKDVRYEVRIGAAPSGEVSRGQQGPRVGLAR